MTDFSRVDILPDLRISVDPTLPGNYLRLGNHHHDLTELPHGVLHVRRHFVTRENLAVIGEQEARPPQPCGASRPPIQDAGWECTGRNLISVTTTRLQGQTLPVVLPARALDALPAEPWWDVRPFTGGDHLHLIPPPPPDRSRNDEGQP